MPTSPLDKLRDAANSAATYIEINHPNNLAAQGRARKLRDALRDARDLADPEERVERTPLNPDGIPKLVEVGSNDPLIADADAPWLAKLVEAARHLGFIEGQLDGRDDRDMYHGCRENYEALAALVYRLSGIEHRYMKITDPDPSAPDGWSWEWEEGFEPVNTSSFDKVLSQERESGERSCTHPNQVRLDTDAVACKDCGKTWGGAKDRIDDLLTGLEEIEGRATALRKKLIRLSGKD